ncbi:hypothetical protein [Streptomyces shenzhenensis]|uniref:hypothetical protein n=1 Tax=Streptomyces shenzhenensis TaxID=943815 RepID=UPI0026CC8702
MSAGGHGRPRVLPLRAAAFVGRTLRGEWQGIVVDPLRQLRRRGPFALSLAFLAAFGVIFFHDLAQRPTGALVVWRLGGVTADLPLWLALLRTPVSLYVPALDLPVWAGITQLFLAFALAELALGRARTLAVAYATTLAGTLTVRVMIALGPGRWGLGLPPEAGQVLDTGPSAAVVGLFTYISVVRRAPVVFVLTGGSMVWESIAVPNLAGREHLIAVAAAIVLGLLHGHRPQWPGTRFRFRLRRASARAGTPATEPDGPAGSGAGSVGAGGEPAGSGAGSVGAGGEPAGSGAGPVGAGGDPAGAAAEPAGLAALKAGASGEAGAGLAGPRTGAGAFVADGDLCAGDVCAKGETAPADAPMSAGSRGARPRTVDASAMPPAAPDSNPPACSAPLSHPDAPPAVSPTHSPSSPASPGAPAASAEPPGSPDSVSDGRCGPILN